MVMKKNVMSLIVAAFVATILFQFPLEGGAAEARRVVVEIKSFKFVPQQPALAPGDTIVWINKDIVPHTVTAKDGSWDSGLIEAGKRWTVTITPDMARDYYCAYHAMMKAGFLISPKPVTSTKAAPNLRGIVSASSPDNPEPVQ